jgi:PAS domain S-box-containing protein
MKDCEKTRDHWIEENSGLRRRIAVLEAAAAERDQAEEALRVSEERYRTLAESTTDIIYILDKNGTLLYANRMAAATIGVTPESLVGKTQRELFPPDQVDLHTARIRNVIETGEMAEMEQLYHFGPQEVWLSVRSIPLRDQQGQVTSVMGVCRNITARKRAEEALQKANERLERRVEERTAKLTQANEELQRQIEERMLAVEALRESEETYRTLVETSPDAVIMLDLQGKVTLASQRAVELYGCDRAGELLGRNPLDFFSAEDRSRFMDNFQKTLERGTTRDIAYTFVRKDGTLIAGEASAAVIRGASGRPRALVAIVRDVGERKQAEEALRQSRDELQAIHEGMFDGLLMADLESGRIARVNPSICQMLGFTENELLSMSLTEIHPPDEVPIVLQRLQARAKKQYHGSAHVRLLRKDGRILDADVASNLLTHCGRPYVVGFFRDITEKKRAEEALGKQHRTLKHLLQSSDRERQLIAYEIHDGLAQQLAGAIMQFQVFHHIQESNPKEAASAFDAGMTLLRQGHFETRRLIAGVRPPILDESGVGEAIAHLVHEQAREKGPKIECVSRIDFDRLVPTLENAIYRICQEALANACQHSKSKLVRVRLVQRGDRVRIEIRDWGAGFDVNKVRENRFGLEGIRQRARLLGGKCSIRSKTDQGTRVIVELPVVERHEAE